MDKVELLARLRNSIHEPYQLGTRMEGTRMIPINHDRSIEVEAGPLRFLVEPRVLDDAAVALQNDSDAADDDGPVFDDFGPSLHIMGADDDLEHLRFDCFAKKPHYHYVRYETNETFTVRIDQYAEGDPIDWTIDRLRRRMPEMLEYSGATDLARAVRDHETDVLEALDQAGKLLQAAKG